MRRSLVALGWAAAVAGCGWYEDGSRSDRAGVPPPPAGSIPRGAGVERAALASPPALSGKALLERGAERYAIFCTPCHGADGHGDGRVVQRGFPPPPPFRAERAGARSPEHVVHVITHGVGAMYPMAERVPPSDRWAIAAYVQGLASRRKDGLP